MSPARRPAAKARRTQEQRSAETRDALVAAAHRLFAARGYAATALDEILAQAGVTRGALYHHFETKADLFRAVFEVQEQAFMAKVAAAARREQGAWATFRAGCEAFLEACLDPATQRISLIDGPAVLGWSAVREIEWRYALDMMRQGIQASMDQGALPARPVEPLAHILFGALSESAMAIARADDPRQTMQQSRTELRRLLQGLAAEPPRRTARTG